MPEFDVSFVTDAPLTLAADGKGAWVQLAKQGRFKDPRYGNFTITQADFDRWLSNFADLSIGDDRAGLPIDVDHGPEKRGDTEAAGWITKLEQRGTELWGLAEWNTLGKQLVGERRYLYLSPSYQHDYADETGMKHGTALVGVGLTNRPFLRMATVSLSAAPPAFASELPAEDPTPPVVPDSRSATMPLPKNILSKLGLGEDATDDAAAAAVDKLLARPESQKTLDQLAVDNGKVVLDATEYAKTVADATAGAAAAVELAASKFEAAFDKALTDPKGPRVTPAQKDGLKTLYDVNADATLAAIDAMPSLGIKVDATGSGSDAGGDTTLTAAMKADADGDAVDEDRLALHNRTLQLAAEHKVDYSAALDMALAEA
jgi:hypothetical protein